MTDDNSIDETSRSPRHDASQVPATEGPPEHRESNDIASPPGELLSGDNFFERFAEAFRRMFSSVLWKVSVLYFVAVWLWSIVSMCGGCGFVEVANAFEDAFLTRDPGEFGISVETDAGFLG